MTATLEGIALNALLFKVTTTVDGGWRMSFDVPDSDAAQVMQISQLRGMSLTMVIVPEQGGPLDG